MEDIESSTRSESADKSNSVKIIISVILLLLLGFGSWYVFMGSKSAKQNNTAVTPNEATPEPTQTTVFSSIQEALAKSATLQCDYTDESDKKITSYIKGGAIRTDIISTTDAKASGSMIVKDKVMYFWNGKTGTKMSFDISETMKNVTPPVKKSTTNATQDPSDVISSLEKFKDYCKPAVVSDSLFVPPTDVNFTDMSSVMKALPSGAMTQQQIKDLQDKYQP